MGPLTVKLLAIPGAAGNPPHLMTESGPSTATTFPAVATRLDCHSFAYLDSQYAFPQGRKESSSCASRRRDLTTRDGADKCPSCPARLSAFGAGVSRRSFHGWRRHPGVIGSAETSGCRSKAVVLKGFVHGKASSVSVKSQDREGLRVLPEGWFRKESSRVETNHLRLLPSGDGSQELQVGELGRRIGGGQDRVTGTSAGYVHAGQKGTGNFPMPNTASIPVRNRNYVRGKLLATFLRVSEDGVIDRREQNELEEVIKGTVSFADAGAAIHMVDQSNARSSDDRHFGDLVALRRAAIAVLPDSAA